MQKTTKNSNSITKSNELTSIDKNDCFRKLKEYSKIVEGKGAILSKEDVKKIYEIIES